MFENFTCDLNINGKQVHLELWDSGGPEEYQRLRELTYPETDVVVLTFSTFSPGLFSKIESYWIPEIRRNLPDCPIILAGNDCNIWDDGSVSEEAITNLRAKFNIKSYHKVSALCWHGLRDLFDDVVLTGLQGS